MKTVEHAQRPAPTLELDTDPARLVRLGVVGLLLGLGGGLLWAFLAPLDEAIPVNGVVVVEGSRKRVEHLGGGVVEQILVTDGQRVRAGDPLVSLSQTQSAAQVNATQLQRYAAMAALARLEAERDARERVTFPAEVSAAAAADRSVRALVDAQVALFQTRRLAMRGELTIIRESVRGLEAQAGALEALVKGRVSQVQLVQEQLASFRNLREEGFVSRSALLELERQLAEVQSKQSEDLANLAAIRTRLGEFRLRESQRVMEFQRDIESQTSELQRDMALLHERLSVAHDNHQRTVLRAPVDGEVMGLAAHTVGGVIKPGERVMDIVPAHAELTVEARVPPQVIDRVRVGLPADVRIEAFSGQWDHPTIEGRLESVAPDAQVDERTGQRYYPVRIRIVASDLGRYPGMKLLPGMATSVLIKTGERTFAQYLLQPLRHRLGGALTER